MRNRLLLCWLLAGAPLAGGAATYVSLNFNLSTYPDLVPVPGYPVYYAPRLRANFFFYDGLYWLLSGDDWYVSSWYNGPWSYVGPDAVPLYILRVPVRYYLAPPVYFVDWRRDAPPMWGRHWGPDWERRHEGWEHWNQRAMPPRAPLPTYQRQYAGNRYPQPAQQQSLQSQHYRYRPHDAVVQQHIQTQAPAMTREARPAPPMAPAPERQHAPPGRQERQPQQPQPHPERQPQQQPAAPHYGPPAHAPTPLPAPPPERMETRRPPAPREPAPPPRQQALPQGHAAPPHEPAARAERGDERRAPPGRQNEGRRDKEQHDER